MITFEKELLYTGNEVKTSQKTQKEYTLISFLGETGQTFTTMLKAELPKGITQLDMVKVKFRLDPGKYFVFETIELTKI